MKEEILEYFKDINFVYNDCTRFDTLKRMLGELEQEQRTGHWIDVDGIFFKCSECDAYRKMMPAYKEYYCPNCGAKMAESEAQDADND